ncbi:outer membrane protein assembly factor BamE [Spongiibacter sp. KMU-158]|uniref:Outer membrane protein assembly factor BamE n=1 Tax=Spongiibacter pelagi TaxID=2760804 RepID=A0A927C115_9GAMM|nr:outer membrane protein assembly factor BamE [Spongiibacter pelagi]MBD2859290.1 outer membrane protein assembly factor BamE [Spongiibacter pelagi]
MRSTIIAIGLTALLTACSSWEFPGVYRLDIDQGNIITQEMVDQLEIGMSRSQVEYIMGAPLIKDSFEPNRWDYIFRMRKDGEMTEQHNLSAFFNGDVLVKIVTDVQPSEKGKMAGATAQSETATSE